MPPAAAVSAEPLATYFFFLFFCEEVGYSTVRVYVAETKWSGNDPRMRITLSRLLLLPLPRVSLPSFFVLPFHCSRECF